MTKSQSEAEAYNKQNSSRSFHFLSAQRGVAGGYFQPQLRKGYPSRIALDRIKPDSLAMRCMVSCCFVATRSEGRGQRIVGWYRDATGVRDDQQSSAKERREFSYFLKGQADKAVFNPEARRVSLYPGGRGVRSSQCCYALDGKGQSKNATWIDDALEYVDSYAARKHRARA